MTTTENDISKNSKYENDARQKSKTILSEISEIESQIPQLISEIENKLQIFSSKYHKLLNYIGFLYLANVHEVSINSSRCSHSWTD